MDLLGDEKTFIWGAGAIRGKQPLRKKPEKILCVRGPLTRNYLLKQNIDCPECYGDPALLLPLLYTSKCKRSYKIGILPHYVDLDNVFIHKLLKRDNSVKLIDFVHYRHWHDVVDEICSCEFIISSSLHGLILSDAYNTPNVWVKFSDKVYGNGFKFHDYYASVGRTNVSPVIINEVVNLEELVLKHKSRWQPIKIDLSGLVESCPFCNLQERLYSQL